MGQDKVNLYFSAHASDGSASPEVRRHLGSQSEDDTYAVSATAYTDARQAARDDERTEFEDALSGEGWWSGMDSTDRDELWRAARKLWG
jgi:hypothetical protein